MNSKKGQASLEYLSTYTWAILVMIIFIGVLIYFDLFSAEKYTSQHCTFDANFFCHDYIIERDKDETNKFNMWLLLQNNMDREIFINKTKLLDNNYEEIACYSLKIYCRFNETNHYAQALPSNQRVSLVDPTKQWMPTRLCMLEFKLCDKLVPKGDKEEINVELNFSGEGKSATHLSYGSIYTNVK